MRQISLKSWILAVITGVLTIFLSGICSPPATAHWDDLATADVVIAKSTVDINLTLPQPLLATIVQEQETELSIEDLLSTQVSLKSRTQAPAQITVTPLSQSATHRSFQLKAQWLEPIQDFNIHYGLFAQDHPDAQCVATITYPPSSEMFPTLATHIFTPQTPQWEMTQAKDLPSLQQFFSLGFSHMLKGYDHVLFVAMLCLTPLSFKPRLKTLGLFTLAYSVGLGFATFQLILLPPVLIESAIALSVVVMAIANLNHRLLSGFHLWLLGLGLCHGFGFAILLQGLDLKAQDALLPFASFNFGIVLGQWAMSLLILGIVMNQKLQRWSLKGTRWVSLGGMAVGMIWLAQRALGM